MPPWLIAVLSSLGVGLILLLFQQLRFKTSGWTTEERVTLAERLTKFETNQKKLEEDCEFTRESQTTILRILEKVWIPVAHSPHTPEIDKLLEKRDRGEKLSAGEWRTLITGLGEEANQIKDSNPERSALLNGLRAVFLNQLRIAERKEARCKEAEASA